MRHRHHLSKRRFSIRCGALMLVVALAGSPAAAQVGDEAAPEGLRPVDRVDGARVWVRPGADLGVYRKVRILEPEVELRPNWLRDQNRVSVYRITPRDQRDIEEKTARLFLEVFTEELGGEGGYESVDEPAPGVLELRPAIVDLDVRAPDVPRAGRTRTFATSAGAATLVLDLHDSESGAHLARIVDRRVADYPVQQLRWSNQASNRAEARRALVSWARLLRERLAALGEAGDS